MKTIQQKTSPGSPWPLTGLNQKPDSSCARCGGLLVGTFCVSPDQGTSEFQISVWKCLQCGDLFDATILENRWRSLNHQLTQN